ncbi:Fe-S oxidoreductase [Desulfocapsa sulfexigens DSM 10523]|uniref:Glycolate oxidase iron-sulfur subunit n=1 Tax=Desulfocapsa sulfexigens (strain DSM 10523 / SB164P1) TaxID=1167006 RepID=M1NA87_DESSD|nr:(Fe-S)-binding protein [Desulfocapsa sulfexigens]AGF76769.1 Fe-S oxidoreductase [Desulfocapsa sulfexigens DSM 10523]
MSECAKCGACSTVCPVFRTSGREGHTARGKLHLLDTLGLEKSSTLFVDIFSACLLCGACAAVCPRNIDIPKELVSARESFSVLAGPHAYEKYLARKLLDFPGSLTGFRVLGKACGKLLGKRLPSDSGLRLRLAMFQDDALSVVREPREQAGISGGASLSWFPGCSARYLFPDILESCRSILADNTFSLEYPNELACCGLADLAAGDLEGARRSGRKNIEVMETTEGPILVSCASCYAQLKAYPELFAKDGAWQLRAENMAARVVEFSTFLEQQNPENKQDVIQKEQRLRVFYHDPCHLRHGAEGVDRARQQLQKTGTVKVLELPDGPRCCGQGGLFHVAHPEISASIRDQLVEDVLALDPDVITTTCSGCLMQWQQGLTAAGSDVKVLHLAQLLGQVRK